MALDADEVAECDNNLLDLLGQLTGRSKDQRLAGLDVLINFLQNRDGESGGLSGTRLRLGNDIGALYAGQQQFWELAVKSIPLMTGMMARA